MSTILATIDGSGASQAILPVVIKLAREMNANVRLLTVVAPTGGTSTPRARRPQVVTQSWGPGVSPYSTEVFLGADEPSWAESKEQAIDRVIAEGRDYLETAARPMHEAGVEVSLAVVIDPDPAAAIISFAKEVNVDLIAMATHGRSGLNQLVQGSVAAAVVRSGVVPVLLIRPQS